MLVEATLIQLFKKDSSLSRRIHTWLFGKPNMDNQYEINEDNFESVQLIIEAFQSIFKREPSFFSNPALPIKTLSLFYMQHEILIP